MSHRRLVFTGYYWKKFTYQKRFHYLIFLTKTEVFSTKYWNSEIELWWMDRTNWPILVRWRSKSEMMTTKNWKTLITRNKILFFHQFINFMVIIVLYSQNMHITLHTKECVFNYIRENHITSHFNLDDFFLFFFCKSRFL